MIVKWASMRENWFSVFANNKGADQPVQSDQHLVFFAYWKVSYLNLLQAKFCRVEAQIVEISKIATTS